MPKKLKYLVIHCTDTPEGRAVSADEIRRWHLGPRVNKDGTFYYKKKTYPSINALPDEQIGGIDIKKLASAGGGRGWHQVGYSTMFHIDGLIENLVPFNDDPYVDAYEITNGVAGINSISRHIVYVGGFRGKDTLTDTQFISMERWIREFLYKFPDVKVIGHNQAAKKACPGFDVYEKMKLMGVPEKHLVKGKIY